MSMIAFWDRFWHVQLRQPNKACRAARLQLVGKISLAWAYREVAHEGAGVEHDERDGLIVGVLKGNAFNAVFFLAAGDANCARADKTAGVGQCVGLFGGVR